MYSNSVSESMLLQKAVSGGSGLDLAVGRSAFIHKTPHAMLLLLGRQAWRLHALYSKQKTDIL
jgi:hypothetical protein